MKSPLILALFSTVLATACSKEAGAAPATPAAPTNTPAAPAAAAPVANAPTPAAAQPSVTPVPPPTDAPAVPAAAAPAPLKVPTVAELGTFLANIKDGPSATAAKEPLEALVKQLQTAKDAAPAASGNAGALGGLTKAVAGAASKLGISEDVVKQIGTLLEKPEVKAVLGSTLEKLMSLVK